MHLQANKSLRWISTRLSIVFSLSLSIYSSTISYLSFQNPLRYSSLPTIFRWDFAERNSFVSSSFAISPKINSPSLITFATQWMSNICFGRLNKLSKRDMVTTIILQKMKVTKSMAIISFESINYTKNSACQLILLVKLSLTFGVTCSDLRSTLTTALRQLQKSRIKRGRSLISSMNSII